MSPCMGHENPRHDGLVDLLHFTSAMPQPGRFEEDPRSLRTQLVMAPQPSAISRLRPMRSEMQYMARDPSTPVVGGVWRSSCRSRCLCQAGECISAGAAGRAVRNCPGALWRSPSPPPSPGSPRYPLRPVCWSAGCPAQVIVDHHHALCASLGACLGQLTLHACRMIVLLPSAIIQSMRKDSTSMLGRQEKGASDNIRPCCCSNDCRLA